MKTIIIVLRCEILKLRRSAIWWVVLAIFMFIPVMMALMMIVSTHPEIAAKLGIIATKAKLIATNDWNGYFSLLMQVIATMGYIGFGFVTSWVFGREFTEHTIKDLLALPIPRSDFVIAKYILSFLWCIFLVVVFIAFSVSLGFFIGIEGWNGYESLIQIKKLFITSFLTLLLMTPVGFFASYGRGILAPIGFIIVTLIMAQFAATMGLGPYFPWAIPGVYTVPEGVPGMHLTIVSYLILVITCAAGFGITKLWWQIADHQ